MGLREFKKQRTRVALIDTALDLFLNNGYDTTTVDDIAAAVGVSQRTFFRYFAGKEQVALAVPAEFEAVLVEELEARPVREAPVVAFGNAMRGLAGELAGLPDEDTDRYVKAHLLIARTPILLGGNLRRCNELDRQLVRTLAARMNVDPSKDLRPCMIVAAGIATLRLSFDVAQIVPSATALTQIAERVEEAVTLVERTMRPQWIDKSSSVDGSA
jgi:AcrR family transcriptional regulator